MAFAHRGASILETENSIEAFIKAYDLGYRNFELDVNSSLDGEVFVFHDKNLFRLTGKNSRLIDLTAKELKETKICNGRQISTLRDVLERFPNAQFNIDAKSWRTVSPLCNIIEKAKAHNRICIGGFNDFRVRKIIRRLGSEVCFSYGPIGVLIFLLFYFLNVSRKFKAGCLQLPERYFGLLLVSKGLVDFAHRCGLKVHVWTINDEFKMNYLIDLGVDGIMTDNCEGLKRVLKEKNMWNSS